LPMLSLTDIFHVHSHLDHGVMCVNEVKKWSAGQEKSGNIVGNVCISQSNIQ